jgi:hypothetical protein
MADNTSWNIPENATLNGIYDFKSLLFDPAIALEKNRINLSAPLEPPQWIFSVMEQDGSTRRFGTLGNFSVVLGKAKSRKSTLTTLLLAASISGKGLSVFEANLPSEKQSVILFDTEQDQYDVQTTGKRVLRLAGCATSPPDHFFVYSLRQLSTKERLQTIEHGLYSTPNVGVVVIDGIRDLVTDFNDLTECAAIVDSLLRWTAELRIHLVVVIHTNKGDSNARGHLGTELMNKAESAMSVNRDQTNDQISYCKPEYMRGREFSSFAFRYGETDLPEIVTGWIPTSQKNGRAKKAEPSPTEIAAMIPKMFEAEATEGLTFADLKIRLKAAFHGKYDIGDSKASTLIRVLVNESYLTKSGTPGTKNSRYHPSLNPIN